MAHPQGPLALVMVLNLACLALPVWGISACTPLMNPQVLACTGPHDGRSIPLITSNVLAQSRYPPFRWPLDHIFHGRDLMMREVRVLPGINSDHFPIHGSFLHHPAAGLLNDTPEADAEDHEKAQEKIDDADPEKKVIREKY